MSGSVLSVCEIYLSLVHSEMICYLFLFLILNNGTRFLFIYF